MAKYIPPKPPKRGQGGFSGKGKPAVRKRPSKEDASGRMSQPKPNGKRVKPAKPVAPSDRPAKKPAFYVGPKPTNARPQKSGGKKSMPSAEKKKSLRDIAGDAFKAATYFPYGMIADAVKPSTKSRAVASFSQKYPRKRKK